RRSYFSTTTRVTRQVPSVSVKMDSPRALAVKPPSLDPSRKYFQAPVDVLPVADTCEENHEALIFDDVNHPVVAHSQSEELLGTLQLLDASRAWIVLQALEFSHDLPLSLPGKSGEFLRGSLEELDRVHDAGGLQPQP